MHSRWMVLALGAGGGVLVGYLTRPEFMGVPIPLKVLFNQNTLDTAIRSDLRTHLVLATIFGIIAAFVMQAIGRGWGGDSVSAERGYDKAKWQTLVDLDPDIAKAAEEARSKDAACEAELARKYLVLEDKSYLEVALKQVIEAYEVRKARERDMAAIEIKWTSRRRIGDIELNRGVAHSRHGESSFLLHSGVWTIEEGYLKNQSFNSEQELREALAD